MHGRALLADLSSESFKTLELDPEMLKEFVGGRGLAIRFLLEMLPRGVDPISPENLLILATGPLTGSPIPSSGKMVVASKSPLTGGYADGNIGTKFALGLKMNGYDALIVKGRAKNPSALIIDDGKARLEPADDLWGLNSFALEDRIEKKYGGSMVGIGPAGENLVLFSTVVSHKGRSGGRAGLGAVMGSKLLKAVVAIGGKELEWPREVEELGSHMAELALSNKNYDFWMRQGTMAIIEWANKNSVLPSYNFREGVFEQADDVSGSVMERLKIDQRGCPNCKASCGNVVLDAEGMESELDYENVAMLGPNLGIGDLREISVLNRIADELGLDTISLGNVLGFSMEAKERGLLEEGPEWGDCKAAMEFTRLISAREGIGNLMADGVKRLSEKVGGQEFAMHVKGLEVSAYDCHIAPAMALAYGTSPIGAHHKDAWVIGWELSTNATLEEKVDKVIEQQRIRGGFFESAVVCRFPWIELGLQLELYSMAFKAVTGLTLNFEELGDRIYSEIRKFWSRELGGLRRELDMPPKRWFLNPLSKGPYAGRKLDPSMYGRMLDLYYAKRWGKAE